MGKSRFRNHNEFALSFVVDLPARKAHGEKGIRGYKTESMNEPPIHEALLAVGLF